MVVGFVGIVLFGFLPGDDFGLVNVKTDAYLPRVVNSQSYWKEKAEPFAVPEYAASSNGAMTMALQNKYEDATLILTRINATITLPKMPDVKDDSVAVAKRLSLKFEPGEKKTVELTHNAKAPPGEIYEIYLDFTYKYQNGTEMKQFGAKPLVGKFV